MDHENVCAAFADELDRTVGLARTTALDAPVPSCPGWTVGTLLAHLGRPYFWAEEVVRRRATGPLDPSTLRVERPADPAGLPDWLAERGAGVLEALRGIDGDAEIWTWGPDHHARFWARRMLHETVVHRGDLALAAGKGLEVAPEIAVDGIDELLANSPTTATFRGHGDDLRGHGETLHVHATDTPGEWMITLGPDGMTVTKGHGKGDLALRGPAADLLWVLYQRLDVGTTGSEVFGDGALLARWLVALTT